MSRHGSRGSPGEYQADEQAGVAGVRMLGKIEGGRRRGRQRMRWLDGKTDSMDIADAQ